MKRNDSCPYLPDNSISSVYVTPETKAKSKSLDRKSHHGIKSANQSAIKSLFMNLKYQESDARSDTSGSRMNSKVSTKQPRMQKYVLLTTRSILPKLSTTSRIKTLKAQIV